jgi:transposase-like protein
VGIRQVICSTNAIASLNARYRRVVMARGLAITFGDRFPAAETY